MKRAVLFLTLVVALAGGFQPAGAYTVKSGRLAFHAAIPCTVACAYWLEAASGVVPGVNFNACRHPFPPGSYSDKVLTAPRYSDSLVVKIYPTVDWDLALCSKPTRGNNGRELAFGANSADTCQIGCVETIRYPVRPGVRYVVRAYNWSDGPDLVGRYWFQNT